MMFYNGFVARQSGGCLCNKQNERRKTMINIKELSVGNWVKFPHGIEKITNLPYIEFKGRGGLCAGFAGSSTAFPVSVKYLEPIAITPEILEKNGWKLGEYSSATLEIENKIVVLEFYESGTQLRIFQRAEDEDLQILDVKVSGLHQLQNALTLCGIDKEIEL